MCRAEPIPVRDAVAEYVARLVDAAAELSPRIAERLTKIISGPGASPPARFSPTPSTRRATLCTPVRPSCNPSAARVFLKSVIISYSPCRSLPHFWDDCRRAACPSLPGRGWSPEDPAAEGELRSSAVTHRRPERSLAWAHPGKRRPYSELLSSRSRVRVAAGAKLSMRMPASFLPWGKQAAGPLPCRGQGASQSRHGRPATIGQILPPGRDLASSVSAGRRGGLVIWRASPLRSGGGRGRQRNATSNWN